MPPTSSIGSSKHSLLAGALHTLLVGTPRIPTHPSTDFPTPLSKLFAVSLCGLQLFAYFFSAVGGVTLWALAQWQGWDDPLKGSLLLSFALEGWCVIGMALGLTILVIGRRWAISSGVEWGWMGRCMICHHNPCPVQSQPVSEHLSELRPRTLTRLE